MLSICKTYIMYKNLVLKNLVLVFLLFTSSSLGVSSRTLSCNFSGGTLLNLLRLRARLVFQIEYKSPHQLSSPRTQRRILFRHQMAMKTPSATTILPVPFFNIPIRMAHSRLIPCLMKRLLHELMSLKYNGRVFSLPIEITKSGATFVFSMSLAQCLRLRGIIYNLPVPLSKLVALLISVDLIS